MESDPFFTIAVATICIIVGMICHCTRRMNAAFALAVRQQDSSKMAVAVALDVARQTTNLMARVEHRALQAVGIVPKTDQEQAEFEERMRDLNESVQGLSAGIVDAAPTVQQAADALIAVIGDQMPPFVELIRLVVEKMDEGVDKVKGQASGRAAAALGIIEYMEADIPLPPIFWATEMIEGQWYVMYEHDSFGVWCFPPAQPIARPATALEARYVAARLNLHEASRQVQRPMITYEEYRPELAELFGEVWNAPVNIPS